MLKNDLLRRIDNMIGELTKSQANIADYILKNPLKVTSMTVTDLAKASHSSPASVTRFCESLGVNGFSNLKVELAAAISADKDAKFEIEDNEPLQEMKDKLLDWSYQAMNDTINYLNEEKLNEVNEFIENSKKMYTFGVGSSYLVAENIVMKWSRLGKTVICDKDEHSLVMKMTADPKKSVLILISNSGETKSVLTLQKIAKEEGIPVISVTQFGSNSLSNRADLSIHTVKANESPIRLAATSSLYAQIIAVDVIFYYYTAKRFDESVEKIIRTENYRGLLNE